MKHLSIDIETFSDVDIKKSGLFKYCESPVFELLLFAYAYDFGDVYVVDLAQGEKIPDSVISDLNNPEVIKHAYNASFEITGLNRCGYTTSPDQWRCTMLHGLYLGYPAGLAFLGAALGIPEDKRNTATTDWAYALVIVGSLSPLEGRTVSILADGNVHPQETVANGAVTLQYAASRLSIGLAYQSYLRTLRINVIGGETTQNKKKLVNSVSLVCQNTRGLFAGARESELREFRPEKRTDYTSPLGTTTGLLEQAITCSWETGGSILIRQSDPLPATILSVIPNITVGGV